MLTYLLLLLASASVHTRPRILRIVERCGIRIEVPRALRAGAASKSNDECTFQLDPPRWAVLRERSAFQEPEHIITISVSPIPFASAADKAGFMRVAELRRRGNEPARCEDFAADDWVLPGGPGPDCNKATTFTGTSFYGVAGASAYGRLRRDGTRLGLADSCSIALSDGDISVVVEDSTGRDIGDIVAWLSTLQRASRRPAN